MEWDERRIRSTAFPQSYNRQYTVFGTLTIVTPIPKPLQQGEPPGNQFTAETKLCPSHPAGRPRS